MLKPSLTVPEPLRSSEEGTFAHYTVTVRLPNTVRRVIDENDFPPEIEARLEALIQDLPAGRVRPLKDESAPDAAAWDRYLEPYLGETWLEIPWFLAETYFFRRILEATGYFEEGPGQGVDPFAYQKQQGLEVSRLEIRALSQQLADVRSVGMWDPDTFAMLLHLDLWGNQADLNMWPAGDDGRPRHADTGQQREHLLADDTQALLAYLAGLRHGEVRVDVVADNAGFEFVCDLALADYLLSSGLASSVRFHLKGHPVFVSDALVQNVGETIRFLAADEDAGVRALADSLQRHLDAGSLRLQDDLFWTSPLSAWEMPESLHQALTDSSLIISKGDANYRRLVGDREWTFTTPFAEIVSYFPAPLLALRTLKSEVAAGIAEGRTEALRQLDPEWLVNGRWGVIQFFNPAR